MEAQRAGLSKPTAKDRHPASNILARSRVWTMNGAQTVADQVRLQSRQRLEGCPATADFKPDGKADILRAKRLRRHAGLWTMKRRREGRGPGAVSNLGQRMKVLNTTDFNRRRLSRHTAAATISAPIDGVDHEWRASEGQNPPGGCRTSAMREIIWLRRFQRSQDTKVRHTVARQRGASRWWTMKERTEGIGRRPSSQMRA